LAEAYVGKPLLKENTDFQQPTVESMLEYNKLFDSGAFLYLGQTTRVTWSKPGKGYDVDFRQFLDTYQMPFPHGYLHGWSNPKAELRSVMKYAKPQIVPPNQRAWLQAVRFMYYQYYPIMCGSSELTSVQAWDEMKNHHSSAGYYWSELYQDKAEFMSVDGFLQSEVYYQGLEDGTSWVPVWTDSVKEENRPFEKILALGQRTFCASPTEHTHALVRLCGDMNAKFYNQGRKCQRGWFSAVGMCKFYRGWHDLANRISRGGKFTKGLCLDAKEWDSSMNELLLTTILEMRQLCLQDEASRARLATLYREIIWSTMVLTNGMLVQKTTGNPSGSGNTVVDNTIGLYLVRAYAFCCAYEEQFGVGQMPTYEHYHENVEAALYGDDDTAMYSDGVASWLRPERLAKFSQDLGFRMTTETGDWSYHPLGELSFLSQKFHMSEYGVWVPQADPQKVLCSQLYGTDTQDVRWSLMRATALLIEGFWAPEVRLRLRQYIEWILQFRRKELSPSYDIEGNEVPFEGDVTIKSVMANVRPDRDILGLYLGNPEGSCVSCKTEHAHERRQCRVVKAKPVSDIRFKRLCVSRLLTILLIFCCLCFAMPKPGKVVKKAERKVLNVLKRGHLVGGGKPKKMGGHGAYSIGDIARAVATPFTHSSEGAGAVNKGARTLGAALGSATGIPGAGTALGNAASWFAKLIGFGEYGEAKAAASGMNQNSLLGIIDKSSGFNTNATASFSGPHGAAVRLRHREYIQDVVSTTAFTNTSYFINPGNPAVFPWLSQMARMYEKFKLHGCCFEYVPLSGTAQASTLGVGSVSGATDYDTYDVAFPNKRVMQQQQFSKSLTPYEHAIFPVECAYAENQFNVFTIAPGATTTASLTSLGDFQKFGPGIFQLATAGQPANSVVIGELWITYDIEMLWPTGETSTNSTIFTQHVTGTVSTGGVATVTNFTSSTGATFGNPATWGGGYFVPNPGNSSGANVTLIPNNTLLCPGNYLAIATTFSAAGNVAVTSTNNAANVGNSTAINRFNGNTVATSLLGWATGGTQTGGSEYVCQAFFTTPDTTSGILLPVAYGASSTWTWDIWILGLGGNVTSNPITLEREMVTVEDRLRRVEHLAEERERRQEAMLKALFSKDESNAEVDETLRSMVGDVVQTAMSEAQPNYISERPDEDLLGDEQVLYLKFLEARQKRRRDRKLFATVEEPPSRDGVMVSPSSSSSSSSVAVPVRRDRVPVELEIESLEQEVPRSIKDDRSLISRFLKNSI
jgi:hypothetical protein